MSDLDSLDELVQKREQMEKTISQLLGTFSHSTKGKVQVGKVYISSANNRHRLVNEREDVTLQEFTVQIQLCVKDS